MVKVVFWNCQRLRTNESYENGQESVAAIAKIAEDPEIIVLCETVDFEKESLKGLKPHGYEAIIPDETYAKYFNKNTLAFSAFRKNNTNYTGVLLPGTSETQRPALCIYDKAAGAKSAIVFVHLPSVSNTVGAQLKALSTFLTACDKFLNFIPSAFMGDFNINLTVQSKKIQTRNVREIVEEHFKVENLEEILETTAATLDYKVLSTDEATHKSGSFLDWAFIQNEYSGTIKVLGDAENGKVSKSKEPVGHGKRKPKEDDEEWTPALLGITKASDHRPIFLNLYQ